MEAGTCFRHLCAYGVRNGCQDTLENELLIEPSVDSNGGAGTTARKAFGRRLRYRACRVQNIGTRRAPCWEDLVDGVDPIELACRPAGGVGKSGRGFHGVCRESLPRGPGRSDCTTSDYPSRPIWSAGASARLFTALREIGCPS